MYLQDPSYPIKVEQGKIKKIPEDVPFLYMKKGMSFGLFKFKQLIVDLPTAMWETLDQDLNLKGFFFETVAEEAALSGIKSRLSQINVDDDEVWIDLFLPLYFQQGFQNEEDKAQFAASMKHAKNIFLSSLLLLTSD